MLSNNYQNIKVKMKVNFLKDRLSKKQIKLTSLFRQMGLYLDKISLFK